MEDILDKDLEPESQNSRGDSSNKFECTLSTLIGLQLYKDSILVVSLGFILNLLGISTAISWPIGIGLATCYLSLLLLYIFYTNNDLTIEQEKILITNTLFPKLSRREFAKQEIAEVIFKEQRLESFKPTERSTIVLYWVIDLITSLIIPFGYKWIRIHTKNGAEHTFFFFGLEYENYDHPDDVQFESMFLGLAKAAVKVRWRSIDDSYFRGLQAEADEMLMTKE